MVRTVAGRGNQRGQAFETRIVKLGSAVRECSRRHYREALRLNRCQDDYFHLNIWDLKLIGTWAQLGDFGTKGMGQGLTIIRYIV